MDIPMNSGAYFVNKKLGVRTFTADFSIKAEDKESVMYRADDLAEWLHYDEPQPLIFRDKPDIHYMAIVDGTADITKFSRSGKGQITFLCLDPHGYGTERTYAFNPTNTDPIVVTNGGNKETAPILKMEITQNVTDFAILTDNEMLYFGEPFDSTTKTASDLNPRILSDACTTTNGWTQGLTVDGGTVAGTLVSSGDTFSQFEKNYGTGSNWHGGSLIKDLGHPVQDFTAEMLLDFSKGVNNQIGRMEMYLLDANGNKIGKVALADSSRYMYYPVFEARAGSLASGKYFANTKLIKMKKLKGGRRQQYSPLANMYGIVRISRKGKKWTALVAWRDEKGKYHTLYSVNWTDSKGLYQSKLAAIQIHIGASSNVPAITKMTINHVLVIEHLAKPANTIDYVFRKGDILEIDCNTGEILKDGEPYFADLYPTSSFLKLEKGINGISVNTPVIKNGTITFRERWL
jgi:predicted phage tail component-like protein